MKRIVLVFIPTFFLIIGWKAGDKADIEWNGVWYRGNIKTADTKNAGAFCVHYEGWETSYDECGITANRLAPLGSKAAAKTSPTTGGGASSSGNFEYDYCGGKSKSSCPSDKGCGWNGSKCVKK